jgi:hypothetical protein
MPLNPATSRTGIFLAGFMFVSQTACSESAAPSADAGASDAATEACSARRVMEATGHVESEDGEPISGAVVQPCVTREDGTWLCLNPVETAANGAFEALFDGPNACLQKLAMRVLDTNENASRATAYCLVDLAEGPSIDLGRVSLPSVAAPSSVDGRTARYASGVELEVGERDGDPAELLTAVVARDEGCGLDAPEVLAAVAFGPEGILRETTVRAIPVASVPDGTTVTVSILGGLATYLADGTLLTSGALAPIGEGTVTGGRLTLDLSLPYANWLVVTAQSTPRL